MKIVSTLLFIASIVISFVLGSYYYYLLPFHDTNKSASVIVYPTKGNQITGDVTFTQETKGVRIIANIQGLTQGKHGFHIHKYGNCGHDNATCAGDHFNPT